MKVYDYSCNKCDYSIKNIIGFSKFCELRNIHINLIHAKGYSLQ